MKNILIVGALGQLGSEIAWEARKRYGNDHVVLTDIRDDVNRDLIASGPFERLDSRDGEALAKIVRSYHIDTIFHLAALLSANGEQHPQKAWDVNINGLLATLEVAREEGTGVFVPSSIGAFGPTTPKMNTPQDTVQRPASMYGVTKVAGELLCDYYHAKYGVDTRGVRFPGIISNLTPPGGGTTDYAVEIYYAAVDRGRYTCFLKGDTYLDMMYSPDAVRAVFQLMETSPQRLKHRNAFNITSMSLCPEDIASSIRKRMHDFVIEYDVDPVRQAIADSWPDRLDDHAAREEWDWKPAYGLDAMTDDMLETIERREKRHA